MKNKPDTTMPTEKKNRIVSPEIAALRDEHKAKVAALKGAQVSAATLKRITEDLLPKLTADDRCVLATEIETYNATKPAN